LSVETSEGRRVPFVDEVIESAGGALMVRVESRWGGVSRYWLRNIDAPGEKLEGYTVVVLDVKVANRWLAGGVGFSFFTAQLRNGACAAWQPKGPA